MHDSDETTAELLTLNQRLLNSILAADWGTYEQLCDSTLSAFEPEARGHLVEGMEFHHFYFDLFGAAGGSTAKHPPRATMCSPHVRMLGDDVAVISYVRLVQKVDAAGMPVTSSTEETRVWQRQSGQWQHVHFHRSQNA